MNGFVIGALMAFGMAQQATDTTVAVDRATLLDVESMAGSIVVNVWDRNEVRVQAEHSRRTYVDVDHRGSRISVEPEADRGPASRADFTITMPADMDLKVEGFMVDITVNGAMGDVEAETLEGDVTVRGGRGHIKVASMSGFVLIEGADGDIEVESAARDVRIVNSSGTIVGETMGGNLVFQNVRATSVDVGSVGGQIWYDGTYDPGGTYFFGSHGGTITLVVPEGSSAQFDLSTIHGHIEDNLSGEMREAEDRETHTLEVGGGGAIVEAETFGGRISVIRKGTEGEPPEPGEWDIDMGGMGMAFGALEGLSGILSSSVSTAVAVSVDASHMADWSREWALDWSTDWSGDWAEGWTHELDHRLDARREATEERRRQRRGGGL